MRAPTSICIGLLLFCIPALAQVPGEFIGRLILKDEDPNGRDFRLVEPFSYRDSGGVLWEVKPGTIINGASIPQIFWSFLGGPYTGPYRRASVIHDYYCTTKERPWEQVHRMFYDAMRASGVAERQAKLMYYAVWRFGPRWRWVIVSRSGITPDGTKTIITTLRRLNQETAAIDKKEASTLKQELLDIDGRLQERNIDLDELVAIANRKKPIRRTVESVRTETGSKIIDRAKPN